MQQQIVAANSLKLEGDNSSELHSDQTWLRICAACLVKGSNDHLCRLRTSCEVCFVIPPGAAPADGLLMPSSGTSIGFTAISRQTA